VDEKTPDWPAFVGIEADLTATSLTASAARRHRTAGRSPFIMCAMAKAEVTDPTGTKWTIRRWWFSPMPWQTGLDSLDAIIFVIMLPFMLLWPFWLISKWLGAAWSIEILRDGKKVGEEKARGWRKSGERINAIAQAAAGGMLTSQYAIE
jgi:hypothetical protein